MGILINVARTINVITKYIYIYIYKIDTTGCLFSNVVSNIKISTVQNIIPLP